MTLITLSYNMSYDVKVKLGVDRSVPSMLKLICLQL